MTFDDGIVFFYDKVNTAEPGNKPVYALRETARACFHRDELGVTRYYYALQAGRQVEAVISVYRDAPVRVGQIAAIDCTQYRVDMVQPTTDDDGIEITRVTLVHTEEHYGYVNCSEIPNSSAQEG